MCEHHESWSIGREFECRLGDPRVGCRPNFALGVLMRRKCHEASGDCQRPERHDENRWRVLRPLAGKRHHAPSLRENPNTDFRGQVEQCCLEVVIAAPIGVLVPGTKARIVALGAGMTASTMSPLTLESYLRPHRAAEQTFN
jgi:hypothetical protein